MKFLNLAAAALFVFASSSALAVPKKNKLITPDKVERTKGNIIEVTYTLPCESIESVSFVFLNDDSGDRTVAVGVVYSSHYRNCRAAAPQQFSEEVNIESFGYGDADFVPMDVD